MAVTASSFLMVCIAFGAMFQAGFNPTSFNTIQYHIERFANVTSQRILDYKSQNITSQELKEMLEQNTATLNGMFQILATIGAMSPILLEMCPQFKKLIGTKTGLWIPITLSIIGSTMTAFCKDASNYEILFWGSLVKGIASGLFTHYAPLLISETVPKKYKNLFGCMSLIVLELGYLAAILLGIRGVLGEDDTWAYILGVPGCVSALMFFAMFFIPETPTFLLQTKKDTDMAKISLMRLRGSKDLDIIEKEFEELKRDLTDKDDRTSTLSGLWNDKEQRRNMFACIILQLSRQSTFALALVYYSTMLFKETKVGTAGSQNATAGMILALLVGTVCSLYFIIKDWTLKTLYLLCLGVIIICLMSVTVILHLMHEDNFKGNFYPYPVGQLLIVFTVLLVLSFGLGPAAIPWQMPFVIMAPKYRFAVSTMSATVNWGGSTANAFLFPWMKSLLKPYVFLPSLAIEVVLFFMLMYLLPFKEEHVSKDNDKEKGDTPPEESYYNEHELKDEFKRTLYGRKNYSKEINNNNNDSDTRFTAVELGAILDVNQTNAPVNDKSLNNDDYNDINDSLEIMEMSRL